MSPAEACLGTRVGILEAEAEIKYFWIRIVFAFLNILEQLMFIVIPESNITHADALVRVQDEHAVGDDQQRIKNNF